MWRKPKAYHQRRVDVLTIIAALFGLTLIASMIWMAATGNRFCCDPKSLLGQLRHQLFTE